MPDIRTPEDMTGLTIEKPFEAPWHAAGFALAVHLHEKKLFTWPEWAAALAAALDRHDRAGGLDGGDDYYSAWLNALESLITGHGVAAMPDITAMVEAWRTAYLETPHGQPVTLGASGDSAG